MTALRILVVTPHYPPDLGPSAPLVGMLCADLVALGQHVTVLTAVPHYPSGQVPVAYRGTLVQRAWHEGVEVRRLRVPSGDRSRLSHRALVFAAFQALATAAGLVEPYDVLIITNPAIETWLPFAVLAVLRRRPAVFGVWDLYPDVGIRLGIFRHPTVATLVGALEQFCLRRARAVQILSEEFRTPLVQRGSDPARIVCIPPWVDTSFLRPLPRDNAFSDAAGLAGAFVVLYAGNLGHSQGLETALAAAALLAGQPQIRLVFVGDGPARAALVEQAERQALANVQFLPFQSRERLPEVLACADAALVMLKPGLGTDALPSKTFPLLACGRPILASVDSGCATWDLVQRSGAGFCLPPGDPAALARAIRVLHANPALGAQLGARGRGYACEHHARRAAALAFLQVLGDITQGASDHDEYHTLHSHA